MPPSDGLSNDSSSAASACESAIKQGIFLHAGWRSAGTWIWSRLRALDKVAGFYEPLSNVLADLGIADVSASRPTLTSGHPPLAKPYFDEYRPFLHDGARGVAGYRRPFGTDRFASAPDAEFPALHGYLSRLCEHAVAQGHVPALKFCRSSGRLPWLQQAFPNAMHVALLRNPASHFASGWLLSQQWSNPFFVAAPFRVLGLNHTEPLVKQVIEICGVNLPPVPRSSDDAYAMACEQYARTAEGNNAYRAFVALWILCAVRMAQGVDSLIDVDRLGQSREYAVSVSDAFHAQCGISPDFGGARDLVEETRRSASRMSGIDGRAMRAVHSAALKFFKAQSGADAVFTETIRGKMVLANELTDAWR